MWRVFKSLSSLLHRQHHELCLCSGINGLRCVVLQNASGLCAWPPNQCSLERKDSTGRERMTNDRPYILFFCCHIHPIILSSPLSPHIIILSSVSICQPNLDSLYMLADSTVHLALYDKNEKKHDRDHLSHSVCRDASFFLIWQIWHQGYHHIFLFILAAVSAEPSRPGRLDYISAGVRPWRRLHSDYKFHFLTIHPHIHPVPISWVSLSPNSFFWQKRVWMARFFFR